MAEWPQSILISGNGVCQITVTPQAERGWDMKGANSPTVRSVGRDFVAPNLPGAEERVLEACKCLLRRGRFPTHNGAIE